MTQSERTINWLIELSSAERKGLCLSFNPMSNLGLPYADRSRGRGWVGQVAKFHSSACSGNSSHVSCEWRMRWGGSPSSYRYVKYSDTWWWEFTLEEVYVGPQAPPLLAVLHLLNAEIRGNKEQCPTQLTCSLFFTLLLAGDERHATHFLKLLRETHRSRCRVSKMKSVSCDRSPLPQHWIAVLSIDLVWSKCVWSEEQTRVFTATCWCSYRKRPLKNKYKASISGLNNYICMFLVLHMLQSGGESRLQPFAGSSSVHQHVSCVSEKNNGQKHYSDRKKGIKTRSVTTGRPKGRQSDAAEADFPSLGVQNFVARTSLAFNLRWRRDNKALFPDLKEDSASGWG